MSALVAEALNLTRTGTHGPVCPGPGVQVGVGEVVAVNGTAVRVAVQETEVAYQCVSRPGSSGDKAGGLGGSEALTEPTPPAMGSMLSVIVMMAVHAKTRVQARTPPRVYRKELT